MSFWKNLLKFEVGKALITPSPKPVDYYDDPMHDEGLDEVVDAVETAVGVGLIVDAFTDDD